MTGETNITLIGRLTDEPSMSFTPSGAPVANFTVATNARTFDKQANEWKDGPTSFYRCAAWRQLAENVAESLQKGMGVIVSGAQTVREYERQDGSKGTSVEINVDEIGPSLRFATAKVTRANRSGGNQPQQQSQSSGSAWGGQSNAATDPWSSAPAAGQTEAPF